MRDHARKLSLRDGFPTLRHPVMRSYGRAMDDYRHHLRQFTEDLLFLDDPGRLWTAANELHALCPQLAGIPERISLDACLFDPGSEFQVVTEDLPGGIHTGARARAHPAGNAPVDVENEGHGLWPGDSRRLRIRHHVPVCEQRNRRPAARKRSGVPLRAGLRFTNHESPL